MLRERHSTLLKRGMIDYIITLFKGTVVDGFPFISSISYDEDY